jgi:hypothetical protein
MNRILQTNQIITGVKTKKNKATFNSGSFDKKLPLGEHNFPLTKYTTWSIYGYVKDRYTGLKRPRWETKVLPTGKPLRPRDVGMDGFFTVKPLNQIT